MGAMARTESITDAELRALWDKFIEIVAPRRAPLVAGHRTPTHAWKPGRYWRAGVETSPGREAYPGCGLCGLNRERHPQH